MLTRLRFQNFKRFKNVDIELGKAVVLIGPNNSGKTTALQALALWDVGLRRWNEKRRGRSSPEKRPGVTVNRRDLAAIPIPDANLLWRDLHIRDVQPSKDGKHASQTTNVRVEVIVDGVNEGRAWSCGFEFDYANTESFYCRPLRVNGNGDRMPVPDEAAVARIALLPPMSGLADREFLKQPGEVSMLIGQGQTAQVLRNLCFQIYGMESLAPRWNDLVQHIKTRFGVELSPPEYIAERGEIVMSYRDERNNYLLDLSSSGRGLQQTLLLLAHLYANPGAVLLLDEPDAHLEILRQRETYNLLIQVAEQQGSQIIAASHSEVVLNEAAGRDVVVAFVGRPHRIGDHTSQVLKSLRDIGFDQYYQAQDQGWVLYLENATDLAILQEFGRILDHEAAKYLARPFVKYVETNLPQRARDHFHGLREAKADLLGIAIFDRLDKKLTSDAGLTELMWQRREIENYFCAPEVLLSWATRDLPDNLFGRAERPQREDAMNQSIEEVTNALATLGKGSPWSADAKVSDDFLDPLFKAYCAKLKVPLQIRKSEYHVLAGLLPKGKADPEIAQKLDAIVTVAKGANRGA